MLDFNLYLKNGAEYILYRSSQLKFGIQDKQKLLENKIKELYVPEEDISNYQKYIEENIKNLLKDDSIEEKAKAAIVYDSVKLAVRWMWMALAMGGLYLAIKYWEFNWNSAHGYEVESDIFFTVYYYMTFNHFLHVGWGSGALLWGIYRLKSGAYSSAQHEGLETIASYWHMIDLAWIVIFPLLYVLG